MALFDMFNPTKRPIGGTPVLPDAEMRARLMAFNRPTSPWHLIDGSAEGVDFIAEWKITDAEWRETFSKAKVNSVFRITLKFDPLKAEVHGVDYEYSVEWSAGVPNLKPVASGNQRQQATTSTAAAYHFTEELRPYQVFNYRFHTEEIKRPIQNAITTSGWTYKSKM